MYTLLNFCNKKRVTNLQMNDEHDLVNLVAVQNSIVKVTFCVFRNAFKK